MRLEKVQTQRLKTERHFNISKFYRENRKGLDLLVDGCATFEIFSERMNVYASDFFIRFPLIEFIIFVGTISVSISMKNALNYLKMIIFCFCLGFRLSYPTFISRSGIDPVYINKRSFLCILVM